MDLTSSKSSSKVAKPSRHAKIRPFSSQGLLIVIARAVGPKQSHEDQARLLRGVYPERSRRARNDNEDNCKTLPSPSPLFDYRSAGN